jgi:polysaccharide deacetylase family protein (PEP-CTERM system associated)
MSNILSIDVEDWFHILQVDSTPDLQNWDMLESRVERNFLSLLDVFDDAQVSVTCFFLDRVAERYPHLVKEAAERRHEVASHDHAHQLVYCQSPQKFSEDIRRSKRITEDTVGMSIQGYRAPGISITRDTSWAFEKIAEAGIKYDSSVFPASRGHGGINDGEVAPYHVNTRTGPLLEIPVSVFPILGHRVCAFGGGYLRVAPYALINSLSRAVNKTGRSAIYYLHSRENNSEHPRLNMEAFRRFKSYVKLRSTRPRLRRLFRDQDLGIFRDWLDRNDCETRAST